jgi:hypothetical protein
VTRKRHYIRQRQVFKDKKVHNRDQRPQILLAIILLLTVGLKFLATPGVDAKDLFNVLEPLVYIAVTYFFLRHI